jgi:DNA-binding CsgD family transcriptional regulator
VNCTNVERMSAAAASLGLNLTPYELIVVVTALTRLELDGDPEASVVRWAQSEMGLTPVPEILRLAAAGHSVREIAELVGISKSRTHRLLAEARAAPSPIAA